jgi:hypothetical protein
MDLTRELLDPSVLFVTSFGLFATLLTTFTVPAVHSIRPAGKRTLWPLAIPLAAAGVLAYLATQNVLGTVIPAGIMAATCLATKRHCPG